MHRVQRLVLATIFSCCFPLFAHAASVDLAWDPSSTVTAVGYWMKYGTSSGTYPMSQRVVGRLTATTRIDNLTPGATYFFVVVAYRANPELFSAYSNEVSYTVPEDAQPPAAVTNLRVIVKAAPASPRKRPGEKRTR